MYENLQEWFMANKPDENLIYKNGLWPQIEFVRDIIPRILARTYEECIGIRERAKVISTHTSKSVKLPVFELNWNNFQFTMRNNFYDWKVSVKSPVGVELDIDFHGLFNTTEEIHSVYCEGFMDSWVYGSYSENKHKFTFSIPNNDYLFCFFWILKYHVHGGTHVKKEEESEVIVDSDC